MTYSPWLDGGELHFSSKARISGELLLGLWKGWLIDFPGVKIEVHSDDDSLIVRFLHADGEPAVFLQRIDRLIAATADRPLDEPLVLFVRDGLVHTAPERLVTVGRLLKLATDTGNSLHHTIRITLDHNSLCLHVEIGGPGLKCDAFDDQLIRITKPEFRFLGAVEAAMHGAGVQIRLKIPRMPRGQQLNLSGMLRLAFVHRTPICYIVPGLLSDTLVVHVHRPGNDDVDALWEMITAIADAVGVYAVGPLKYEPDPWHTVLLQTPTLSRRRVDPEE